jgi:PadR family transcriptional regulator PadR
VRNLSELPESFDSDAGDRLTLLAMLYMLLHYMATQLLDRELKKGSSELLILSLVESRARHGYEIAKLIETRSHGELCFQVASLYPLLYRLEGRGWIQGRWVERAGQRRRRCYRLTAEGRKVLAAQRQGWRQFVDAIQRITEINYA